jgi:hypothetical protein
MWDGLKGGVVAAGSALAASVCCLLPLALVLLGVWSGAAARPSAAAWRAGR